LRRRARFSGVPATGETDNPNSNPRVTNARAEERNLIGGRYVRLGMFPAGFPREGEWVVVWQTPIMRAPAFWYFDTREEAEEIAMRAAGVKRSELERDAV